MAAIYECLRFIIRIELRIFYRSYLLRGREHLQVDPPVIFVANHPNTLLDVFHPVAFARHRVKFLGNAGLFKNRLIARILDLFYTIKVERPQDVEGKPVNNESAFQKSIDCLKQDGNLMIAPEGTSFANRQLREIKTGAARIALWTASQTHFQKPVKILPIAATYEAPARFRKAIIVQVAPAIELGHYQQAYQYAPQETVRALTEDIRTALFGHCFCFDSEFDEIVIGQAIQACLGTAMFYEESSFDEAMSMRNQLLRSKAADPESFALYESRWMDWREEAARHPYAQLLLHPPYQGEAIKKNYFLDSAAQLLAWAGWINQWIPTTLLRWVVKKVDPYIGYYSTFWFAGGLVLYPLIFWLQYKLISIFSGGGWFLMYLLQAAFTSLIYHDTRAAQEKREQELQWRHAQADPAFSRLRQELPQIISSVLPKNSTNCTNSANS